MLSISHDEQSSSIIADPQMYTTCMEAINNGDQATVARLIEYVDPMKVITYGDNYSTTLIFYALLKIKEDYSILKILSKKSVQISPDKHLHSLERAHQHFQRIRQLCEEAKAEDQGKILEIEREQIEAFYYLLKALSDKEIANVEQDTAYALGLMIVNIVVDYEFIVSFSLPSLIFIQNKKPGIAAESTSVFDKRCKILNYFCLVLQKLLKNAQDQKYELFLSNEHNIVLEARAEAACPLLIETLLKYYLCKDSFLETLIDKAKVAVVEVDSALLNYKNETSQEISQAPDIPSSEYQWYLHGIIKYNYLKDIVAMIRKFMIHRRVMAQILPFDAAEKIAQHAIDESKDIRRYIPLLLAKG